MRKSISLALAGMLIVPIMALGVSVFSNTQSVFASSIGDGAGTAKTDDQKSELFGTDGVVSTITNTALYILGALSVIMLIYGGIRYTISGGESGAVTSAKNTILYAIVGIIVALLAYALVNFVIARLVA